MKPSTLSSEVWNSYNYLFLLEHFLGPNYYQKIFKKTEENLFSKIEKQHLENLSTENASLYDDYGPNDNVTPAYSENRVKVYRGAAKNWPCTQKWNLDYFQKTYGDKEVMIYNSPGLFETEVQKYQTMSMGNYIEELKKGSRIYLKFSPVVHHESSLKTDFDYNWLDQFAIKGSFGKKTFLFLGPEGSSTPIHNALANTVFIQVYGQKKWTFWEPSERLFLGVRPERRGYFYTHLRQNNVDQTRFPLAKYARKFEITLNAGDVLWFPAFYWHEVQNPSDSIGVAYKIGNMNTALKSSRMLTLLTFLSTRPFIIDSMIRSGFKDNERVFL